MWAAVGGARKLAELGIPRAQVEILVVERNPYHGIRVRNYEPDLGNIVIPLAEVPGYRDYSTLTRSERERFPHFGTFAHDR